MRYYHPEYFQPYEYLPPDVYNRLGDAGIIVMDARILWTLDQLRKTIGKPILINNWKAGGQYSQRGLRSDAGTGATYSQHRFGRAVDFDISGVSAQEFRVDVMKNIYAKELTYITRIEDKTSWVHLDCASVPGTEIVFFKP